MQKYLELPIDKPVEFRECGILKSKTPFLHSSRILKVNGVLVGIKGVLEIEQEGIHYAMGPGDMLMLHANRHHSGTAACSDLEYYWCTFFSEKSTYLSSKSADLIYDQLRKPRNESEKRYVLLPEFMSCPHASRIDIIFRQMLNGDQMHYMPEAMNYLCMSLLFEITQQMLDLKSTKKEENMRLGTILAWLRANCVNPLCYENLEGQFHYNIHYLSSLVKSATGYPLVTYINKLRVEKSKEYLLSTDLPVQKISLMVGFSDEHYYMRMFKKFEGMSPTMYRNSHPYTYITDK